MDVDVKEVGDGRGCDGAMESRNGGVTGVQSARSGKVLRWLHRAGRRRQGPPQRSSACAPPCSLRENTKLLVHGCRAMRPTLPRQLRLRKTWRGLDHEPSPRVTAVPEQTALRAAYYRGGTSRALLLQPQDLPASHARWKPLFRQVLRSVGLGEAYGRSFGRIVPETAHMGSICLVEPCHRTQQDDPASPHVDYTHVAIDTKYGYLEVEANSGNLLSAVGPYAYNARLLPPDLYAVKDGEVTITIRNTNTMKLVESTFAVTGGQAAVTGSQAVEGVNGKGSKIRLSFRDPTCSTTGARFPTGNAIDVVEGYKVTCVDGAVPVVFIRADAVGVSGTILPHELKENKDALDLLENIRRAAAVEMGIADTKKMAPRTIPKIAIVSQSSKHSTVSGPPLESSQMDIVVRFISDTEPHSTIPLTGALTTAVAARMPRTIVEQLLAPEEVMPGTVTIAHPSGRIQVKLDYDAEKKPPVWVASVSSTAQRLFEGKAFWTQPSTDAKGDPAPEKDTARHGRGLAFVNENRLRAPPANLIERFYQEGHNTNPDFASLLSKEPQDRLQPSPPQSPQTSKPDLALPIPFRTRDTAHLLRELWHLRTSLTHFTSQYPPKASSPLPEPVTTHLSAIASHIATLTASLKHMPRPPRTITPDRSKGEEWHRWAKAFQHWGRRRGMREAEAKQVKREMKKGGWERWKDSELNALSKRGRPVVMGEWRQKLLRGREGRAHEGEGEGDVAKGDTRSSGKGATKENSNAGSSKGKGAGAVRKTHISPATPKSQDAPPRSHPPPPAAEQKPPKPDVTATESPPPPPQQDAPTSKWPSFKPRPSQKEKDEK